MGTVGGKLSGSNSSKKSGPKAAFWRQMRSIAVRLGRTLGRRRSTHRGGHASCARAGPRGRGGLAGPGHRDGTLALARWGAHRRCRRGRGVARAVYGGNVGRHGRAGSARSTVPGSCVTRTDGSAAGAHGAACAYSAAGAIGPNGATGPTGAHGPTRVAVNAIVPLIAGTGVPHANAAVAGSDIAALGVSIAGTAGSTSACAHARATTNARATAHPGSSASAGTVTGTSAAACGIGASRAEDGSDRDG
jgi:hypothetical protein